MPLALIPLAFASAAIAGFQAWNPPPVEEHLAACAAPAITIIIAKASSRRRIISLPRNSSPAVLPSTSALVSPDLRAYGEGAMDILSCFPTSISKARLANLLHLNAELEHLALELSQRDSEGIAWCSRHGYAGYTSYASVPDLSEASAPCRKLRRQIELHALDFAKALQWDLRGGRPKVDTLWVNVLPPGGSHTSHIHTNSVISGTYYVRLPKGSAAITFEDPRHAMMMAAPPRKATAPRNRQTYVTLAPRPGDLLMWESWLRHEVPLNRAESDRISFSFNCVIS